MTTLTERRAKVSALFDQTVAQANYLKGQLALLDEMIAAENPDAAIDGSEVKTTMLVGKS